LAKLDDLSSGVARTQLGRLTRMDPATISGVVGRLIAAASCASRRMRAMPASCCWR